MSMKQLGHCLAHDNGTNGGHPTVTAEAVGLHLRVCTRGLELHTFHFEVVAIIS